MAERRGFTLVELLITISIIGILAGMMLFAMFQSQETAKAHRTRALIAKLNNVIMRRYDEYRTRRVPIQLTAAQMNNPNLAAKVRLDGLRDLMRLEMPDRWTDVVDNQVFVPSRPAASESYLRKFNATYTGAWPPPPAVLENQGAECLYMIVMECLAREGDSREVFKAADIKDTDGDGFPEFVDGWGMPVRFLRWAPGFIHHDTIQVHGKVVSYTPGSSAPIASPRLEAVAMSGTSPTSQFSKSGGSYGSIMMIRPPMRFYSARIAGYTWAPDKVTFRLAYIAESPGPPPISEKKPFAGIEPQPGDEFVIVADDPFDYRKVYDLVSWPFPDDQFVASFPVAPLIYSSGSDRCFGIRTELPTSPLRYSAVGVNPYIVEDKGDGSGGVMIGAQEDFPAERFYVPSGWQDNITNHDGTRR
jgi:prepilin-type N-terminal cleavage/methylation domain-containing protein